MEVKSLSIVLLKMVSRNKQFQLLVYACRGGWEVRYHIADYAEKPMGAFL